MIHTLEDAMMRIYRHTVYAGGPGSGRHPEGGLKKVESKYGKAKRLSKDKNFWQTAVKQGGPITHSVYKSSEGGEGASSAIERLHDAGIPARKGYSPYVGHEGIDVHPKHAERASKILFR